jgi:hypothetical protein
VISPFCRVDAIAQDYSEHSSISKFVDELYNVTPLADLPDEANAQAFGLTNLPGRISARPTTGCRWTICSALSAIVDFGADSVEKVGISTRPNFFSAVGAVFACGRGGPNHPPQTQRSQF